MELAIVGLDNNSIHNSKPLIYLIIIWSILYTKILSVVIGSTYYYRYTLVYTKIQTTVTRQSKLTDNG